jgi:hypothetical protein
MPDPSAVVRVAAWNAEWAPPGGARGRRVAATLAGLDADVICLTEGFAALLPPDGHAIAGAEPPGHPGRPGQRRVLLWSRSAWRDVDPVGHAELPHEGFVSGTTETPAGPVRVLGLCIPWHFAGVRDGHRRPWRMHLEYLALLAPIVREAVAAGTTVIAGDFNQYRPRIWGSKEAEAALTDAIAGLRLATEGIVPGADQPLIDHVAHTGDLDIAGRRAWPGRDPDGRPLSDHAGVWVDLVPALRARPDGPGLRAAASRTAHGPMGSTDPRSRS